MTDDEWARQVVRRAHAAMAGWTLLGGGLAVIGLVTATTGVVGDRPDGRVMVPTGLAVTWIGTWVVLCAGVVWSYRRRVVEVLDTNPWRARAMARVRMSVLPIGDLGGVELGSLDRHRLARFVDSQWPLVGHVAALGLLVVAASWS